MEADTPGVDQGSSQPMLSDSDKEQIKKILDGKSIDPERVIMALKQFLNEKSDALQGKTLEEKIDEFSKDVAQKGRDSGLDVETIQGVAALGYLIKNSFASAKPAEQSTEAGQASEAAPTAAPAAAPSAAPQDQDASASKSADAAPKSEPPKSQLSRAEMEVLQQELLAKAGQQQTQPGSSMGGAFKYLRDAFDFKGKKAVAEQRSQMQQSAARVDMQSWLDSRSTSDQKLDEVVALTRSYAANAKSATPEQLEQMKTKLDGSIGDLQRAVDFESRKVVDEVQSKRMGVGEAHDQMTQRVQKVSEKMQTLLNSDEVNQNPELKARLTEANEKIDKEMKRVIENLMEMLKRIFAPKDKKAAAPA